ncbi:BtpA/SgcQ family protein [Haloarchaeobius amylolyticus]|uniref:BtpA/SgcQ family protein n=1 Tax=Haloarchaeobius amylolyticus TaxID=1198296 RepID=UPI00226F2BF6|nr:BtpA/SgcQ family protein [Haloarchaeobius amylolyticus]
MHCESLFGTAKPVVGMVHLPPLPGAPRFDGDREAIRETMLADARALEAGGVDAIMVENFGDAPFYPDDVPKHVVAQMAALCQELVDAVDVPVGVNVLRNDADAALSIAAAVDADFVRVNVHVGATVTDQGLLQGQAHETLRLRDRLDADVAVLVDVGVKHATSLGDRPLKEELADACERGLADGIIVSGSGTGDPTSHTVLEDARTLLDEEFPEVPLFVGSGVTQSSVAQTLDLADGVIVGTALKDGGETTNPVAEERVAALVAAADPVR